MRRSGGDFPSFGAVVSQSLVSFSFRTMERWEVHFVRWCGSTLDVMSKFFCFAFQKKILIKYIAHS